MTKTFADVSASIGALGTLWGYLPDVAAVLSIIWLLIRIFEWARMRIFKLPPASGGNE